MKFTLKPYQRTALEDMLAALDRAKTIYERETTPTSVSLSATTGAGKTVMASAVIESLFYGSDDFDFDPDDGAVVIWFSDDPNLNEQTRFRIWRRPTRWCRQTLSSIEPPFSRPKLDAGKVYFLNTQKLSKSSLLTRGHEVVDEGDVLEGMHTAVRPDMQGYTIWQTIANTIDDPDLTLYLIVDEAHRGFGTKATRDKPTIVQRLINGHAGYPAGPDRVGHQRHHRRFQGGDGRRGRLRRPTLPAARPGRRIPGAGIGAGQGRRQGRHSGRGPGDRHGAGAPGRQEAQAFVRTLAGLLRVSRLAGRGQAAAGAAGAEHA